jgi:hypothetical protein
VKLVERRAEADAAFIEVRRRSHRWSQRTRIVRAWLTEHRAGAIVGGGFTAGIAVSMLPIAALMRVASAFAGALSLLLEGPFLRLIAARRHDVPADVGASPTIPS